MGVGEGGGSGVGKGLGGCNGVGRGLGAGTKAIRVEYPLANTVWPPLNLARLEEAGRYILFPLVGDLPVIASALFSPFRIFCVL